MPRQLIEYISLFRNCIIPSVFRWSSVPVTSLVDGSDFKDMTSSAVGLNVD